jgi:excisionase family DNA binding protein
MSFEPQFAHSPEQAAVKLGISKRALYDEMKSGRIEARKYGRRTLFTDEALKAWLGNLPLYDGEIDNKPTSFASASPPPARDR